MVGAALEHLLLREGYEVRPAAGCGSLEDAPSGPVLMLVDGRAGGLHAFETRDVVGALARLFPGERFSGGVGFAGRMPAVPGTPVVTGTPTGPETHTVLEPSMVPVVDAVYVFLPEPFGEADVLRVVRVVADFDGRRRAFGPGGVVDGLAECEEGA